MSKRTITILCSGFGLGFYVPGLLINHNLQEKGINTDVLVFENYLLKEKKDHINDSKNEYHKNFSVALVAQKFPIDIRKSIDFDMVDELLKIWKKENRRDFISLSGHWVYILDRYREIIPNEQINADLVYVDSDLTPSWKHLKKYNPGYNSNYNEVWFFDSRKMEVCYNLSVAGLDPLSFEDRKNRLVVHGGGWGMGTYQAKIPELEEQGFNLDIVAYNIDETKKQKQGNRYFMNKPSWSSWEKNNEGLHEFPPFSEIIEGEIPVFTNNKTNHWLFDVTREVKAIVSKPGAGTLIDSLTTATPIILLEPFGNHEQKNAELWEHLGYGIQYNKWKESGFSMDLIRKMHLNIMNGRKNLVNYSDVYADRLSAIEVNK